MFPEIPKNFESLTDEDLSSKIDEFKQSIQNVAANRRDPDVVGERTQNEVRDEMAAAVEGLDSLKEEMERRTTEAAEYDTEVAELAAKAGVDVAAEADPETPDEPATPDGDTDPDAETTDADAETAEEPEAVAASAGTPKRRSPLPAARKRNRPTGEELDDGSGLRAGVESFALNIDRGDRLEQHGVAQLLTEYVKKGRVKFGDRVVVASASYQFPDDRQLDADYELNARKIEKIAGPQALVASGGLCAPLTPIYDLPGVETAGRPVRDSLPSFQANRGGVIVGATPTMGDYAEAVGVVTAADDATGGTYAAKSCMRIECPDFTSIEVDAIYQCIEAGNLTARAYPELMARIDTLVRAEQARLADGRLLDKIKAGSTAVTDVNTTTTAGAMWKMLGYVHVAAAAYRNRHRMADDARLRVIFPEWLIDLLIVDLGRNNGDASRFKTRAEVERILGEAGIAVTFTKDGPSTGTGQVFAAQTAGNLLAFPAAVQYPLFAEGTWLHLDSGQLDLGIVRDSTLNATNDFQIFAETWENVAYVGVESQWHIATINPNGTNSAAKDYSGVTGTF